MLKIEKVGFEECDCNKTAINAIYPVNVIHYVVNGYGYFNGVRLEPGRAFICRKNTHIEYYPDKKEPWSYYWFRFDDDGFDVFERQCHLRGKLYFDFEETELLPLLYSIYNNFGFLGRKPHFEEKIYDLVLTISRTDKEDLFSKHSLVEEIKEYISDNYQQKISITSLADRFHFSRGYLREIFYKSEGVSIREYLTNLRMDRARELLENSDYSISLIASSVGYDDIIQFSRFFLSHQGCSPSDYRKEFKRKVL